MNKWFKSSVSMVMAALVVASGAAVLTTGAVETANLTASAISTNPYIDSFTVSQTRAAIGTTVYFKSHQVNAGMHYGQYLDYRIVISKDGQEVTTIDDVHCEEKNLKFYATECGKYTATLYITDFYGQVLAPKSVSFEYYAEGATVNSFTCSSQSVIKRVNSPIDFYSDITATTYPNSLYYSSFQFCYLRIYKGNKLVEKLDFNNTPMKRSRWTPTEPGKYTAKVTMLSWEYESAEASFDFDVVESYIESFWATQQYNSFVGQPIQFHSEEKNYGMKYGQYQEYKIVVKDASGNVVKTISEPHKLAEALSFTPTKAGKYTATLSVTDFYGFKFPEKTIDITVVAPYIKEFKVTPKSPILNKEATFSSKLVNTRSYHGMYSKYEISVKNLDNGTVTKLSNVYGSDIKWTPKKVGNYSATLNVVDFYGYKVPAKTIKFKVVKALSATAKLSATSVKAGKSVTATLTAANGAGSNQYAFDYRKVGASSWTVVKGYTTTNKTAVTIKTAGSYEVRMRVKDANGTVVTKTVKLTVTK